MKVVKKNYILLIGLGDWNLSQLQMVNSFNFKSIVTNVNSEALSFKNADIPIKCDSRNYKKIFKILKKKKLIKIIKYVYTGSEFVTSAAYLSKKLKIKWHPVESAIACENKNIQKRLLVRAKILIPKYQELSNFKEININSFKKKVVFKPSDGHASKGVKIINKKKNYSSAFKFSKSFSNSGKVIVEEYINGKLHDINGLVINGKFHRLGISDKSATKPPYAVIDHIEAPSKLSIGEQEKLYRMFMNACKVLKLNHGPVKGDYLRDKNGKFYLLEVSARFHGPLSTLYALPISLNINPFIELLRYLSKKTIRTHKTKKIFQKKTIITADIKKRSGQISLEKKGIFNKKYWKSNYDVPIYNIKINKLRNY